MAGFDERCPHCNNKLNCEKLWHAHDYQSSFAVECRCGKSVQIDVSQSPVFETSKVLCSKCHKAEPNGPNYCDKCEVEIRHSIHCAGYRGVGKDFDESGCDCNEVQY